MFIFWTGLTESLVEEQQWRVLSSGLSYPPRAVLWVMSQAACCITASWADLLPAMCQSIRQRKTERTPRLLFVLPFSTLLWPLCLRGWYASAIKRQSSNFISSYRDPVSTNSILLKHRFVKDVFKCIILFGCFLSVVCFVLFCFYLPGFMSTQL